MNLSKRLHFICVILNESFGLSDHFFYKKIQFYKSQFGWETVNVDLETS